MAVSKLTKVVASYFCPPWNFCAIKKPRPLFSVNFLPHLNFFPNKISLLIFAWNTTSKQFKRQQRLRCCLGQPTRVVVTTNRCRVLRLLQMDELYNASAKVWRSSGRYSSLLLPLQWMLSSSIILTSFKLSTSNTICCKNFFALVEFSSLSLSLSLGYVWESKINFTRENTKKNLAEEKKKFDYCFFRILETRSSEIWKNELDPDFVRSYAKE